MSWKVKVSCWPSEGGLALSPCVWCRCALRFFFCVLHFTILSPIFFFFLNKPVFVHSVVWLKFMLRLMSRVMTAFSRRNQLQTRVSIANRSALTPALQVWVFYVASMAFNPTSDLLLQSSIERTLHIFVEH